LSSGVQIHCDERWNSGHGLNAVDEGEPTDLKIGFVVSTNEPEQAWNAFRYGVRAIEDKHSVKVFLLGRGVECEDITDPEFGVRQMMKEFVEKGGTILTCGTCLKIRNKGSTELCPISTMQDLVNLTVESDRILTFG
jgi:uncharacterized protein involved in oxidation of intracellular sulfur